MILLYILGVLPALLLLYILFLGICCRCALGIFRLALRLNGDFNLILAAADEGVDSCWINYFDPDKLANILGLPENEEVLMVMDLGYAAEGVEPLPNHSSRKPLSETVTYL